jgi:hypothetical protein
MSESSNFVGEASAYHLQSSTFLTTATTSIDRQDATGIHTSVESLTLDSTYVSEGYGYGDETDTEHEITSHFLHQTDSSHSETLTTNRDYQRQEGEESSSQTVVKDGSSVSGFNQGTRTSTSQLHQQTLYTGDAVGSSYLDQSNRTQHQWVYTASGDTTTQTQHWQTASETHSGSEIYASDGSETKEMGYSAESSSNDSIATNDGITEATRNQTGLNYAYSRTAQNGIEQWMLTISRSIEQWVNNLNLSKVWSWAKTGNLTANGDSSWSETLTQYNIENDSSSDRVSVINGVPDQDSRTELERGDELAQDLLNFIQQNEDNLPLLNTENLSYSTKLEMILDETLNLLEGDDKVQLQAQREALLAIGQLVDVGGFHAALDSSLGGLYSEALVAQSTFDTQLFAHDFKWFVKRDGDDLPLKAIVYPTKLLAAVKATPALAGQLENPEFVAALMDLAKAYGAIDPATLVDSEAEPLNFFLDTVWNAQSQADLLQGGDELAAFINSFESPAAVLRYEERLLKVVKQTPDLPEKQDAAFLKELVQLGRTYAGLDPVNEAGENEGAIEFFLDTLWRLQSTLNPNDGESTSVVDEALQSGTAALSTLLDGVADSLQALKFINNLLQAAINVDSLSPQAIHDAQFLKELVTFAFEYAKLNPINLVNANNIGEDTFLVTLWQGTLLDELAIQQVTKKLSGLFEALDTPEKRVDLLKFQTLLVKTVKQLPQDLQDQINTLKFLSELVELAGIYVVLKSHTTGSHPNFFLQSLWEGKEQEGVLQFASFLSETDTLAQRLQSVELESSLFKALIAQVINDDTNRVVNWNTIRTLNEILENDKRDREAYGRLTANEIDYAREIFGDSIDYSQIRITRDEGGLSSTVTLGNTIHFKSISNGSNFQADGRTLTPEGLELLIHEMTHIWQYQNGDWSYASGSILAQIVAIVSDSDGDGIIEEEDRNGAYRWNDAFIAGKDWEDWNPEQQAAAIEEYNMALRAGQTRGSYTEGEHLLMNLLQPYVDAVRRGEGAPKSDFHFLFD